MGLALCSRSDGVVLAASRSFAGSCYVAIAGDVRPGASGGPVLDAGGAMVAIIDLALLKERGVALAVPVERAAARFPRGAVDPPAAAWRRYLPSVGGGAPVDSGPWPVP